MVRTPKLSIKDLKIDQRLIHTNKKISGTICTIKVDSFQIKWDDNKIETWRNTNFLALDNSSSTPLVTKVTKQKNVLKKNALKNGKSRHIDANKIDVSTNDGSNIAKNNGNATNEIPFYLMPSMKENNVSISNRDDNDINNKFDDDNDINNEIDDNDINNKIDDNDTSNEHDDNDINSNHDDKDISNNHDDSDISNDHDDNDINNDHDDNDINNNHDDKVSDKCCVGNNCEGSKVGVNFLEKCSTCRTPIHHLCSEDGRCPKGFGCGATTTSNTPKNSNADGSNKAKDGITIDDISVLTFQTNDYKDFFPSDKGLKKIYMTVGALRGYIELFKEKALRNGRQFDESEMMMITSDLPTGIAKDDPSIYEGFFAPPSPEIQFAQLLIKHGNTGLGWLMDLPLHSFKSMVHSGKIRYSRPSATASATTAAVTVTVTAPSDTSDISAVVSKLEVVSQTLDDDILENCRKAIYQIPPTSLLAKKLMDTESKLLSSPILVKVYSGKEDTTIASYDFSDTTGDGDSELGQQFFFKVRSTEFNALVKTKNFETIKGFSGSITTFPSVVTADDTHSQTSSLVKTITSQKSNNVIKVICEPAINICIQQLRFSNATSQDSRQSTRQQYIILKSDETFDGDVVCGKKNLNHDILFRHTVSHVVITREKAVMRDATGLLSTKEIAKLLICNLYCHIASRKEKDLILLKILTTTCNSSDMFYLVYNVEKKSIELLKLVVSQLQCNFSRAVPPDTLATARDKMVKYLSDSLLLFDISLGINLSNPNFASLDDMPTAIKRLQESDIERYVPSNYQEFHKVARRHLDVYYEDDVVVGPTDSEETDEYRKSKRLREIAKKDTTVNVTPVPGRSEAKVPSTKVPSRKSAVKGGKRKTPQLTPSSSLKNMRSDSELTFSSDNDFTWYDNTKDECEKPPRKASKLADTRTADEVADEIAAKVWSKVQCNLPGAQDTQSPLLQLVKQSSEQLQSSSHYCSELHQKLLDQAASNSNFQQQMYEKTLQFQQSLYEKNVEAQQKNAEAQQKLSMYALDKITELSNNAISAKASEAENKEMRAREGKEKREASESNSQMQDFVLKLVQSTNHQNHHHQNHSYY